MKSKGLYFLITILMLSSCANSDETSETISGRWDMHQVLIAADDVTPDLNPYGDRWIQLNADGTFLSGGGEDRNSGTFTLIKDVLALDSDAGEGDDSQWDISISGDTLKMVGIGTERQQQSVVLNLRAKEGEPGLAINTYGIKGNYRALEVVDEETIWYAGAGGQFGLSEDGGETWFKDSIVYEGSSPHFRSLAVTKDATFLMSIASPALLYRTTDKGLNWDIVYKDEDPGIFYDAMEFWDDKEGIAVGDEQNGCVAILITRDGGQTWTKMACEDLPPAIKEEGFFAASDTNIALNGDEVWLGSTKSRVYYSDDRGRTWVIKDTPIAKGGRMTGIFSIAMYDGLNGILFGGDWEKKELQTSNKAITVDGGKTWNLVNDGNAPGFRSCVRYIPGSNGQELLTVGIPGISYSSDGGTSWMDLSTRNIYTLRFTPSGKYGWIAGADLIGRIELIK